MAKKKKKKAAKRKLEDPTRKAAIRRLREFSRASGENSAQIAERVDLSPSCIRGILSGKSLLIDYLTSAKLLMLPDLKPEKPPKKKDTEKETPAEELDDLPLLAGVGEKDQDVKREVKEPEPEVSPAEGGAEITIPWKNLLITIKENPPK
jgi:hypothetical protein